MLIMLIFWPPPPLGPHKMKKVNMINISPALGPFGQDVLKTREMLIMLILPGHVGTAYKSEALATTLGGGTTPTKSTTMQGRPLPLDYPWIRSFDLRR